MKRLLCLSSALIILSLVFFGCSGGSDEAELPNEKVAQMIKDKLGDPSYLYVSVTGIKPDSELGKMLTKLIDSGVYTYEWGDVRKVHVPNKKEAASYADGDLSIFLNGQMAGNLAVKKVFLEEIKKVKVKKGVATVTYSVRHEPSDIIGVIEGDPSGKLSLADAEKTGELSPDVEQTIIIFKENDVWKVR